MDWVQLKWWHIILTKLKTSNMGHDQSNYIELFWQYLYATFSLPIKPRGKKNFKKLLNICRKNPLLLVIIVLYPVALDCQQVRCFGSDYQVGALLQCWMTMLMTVQIWWIENTTYAMIRIFAEKSILGLSED